MNKTVVALLLVVSPWAHAYNNFNVVEKVRSRAFRCAEPEFVLKGFWGDTLGKSFGLRSRADEAEIGCERAMKDLYRAGAPEFFKVLDQIKELHRPDMFAPLLGLDTKFKDYDVDRIRARLKKLGVDFGKAESRWATAVVRIYEADKANQSPTDLTSDVNDVENLPLEPGAYNDEYFFLPRRKLGESLFHLALRKNERTVLTDRLTEKMLATIDLKRWIEMSGRADRTHFSTLNPIPFLIQSRRQDRVTDQEFIAADAPMNLLTALASRNDVAIKRLAPLVTADELQWALTEGAFDPKIELCPVILGAAYDGANSAEVHRAIIDLYHRYNCRTLDYYPSGVVITTSDRLSLNGPLRSLLNNYTNESYVLSTELLRSGAEATPQLIDEHGRVLARTCSPPAALEPLVNKRNVILLLTTATEVKCEPLMNLLTAAAEREASPADISKFLDNLLPVHRNKLGPARAETLTRAVRGEVVTAPAPGPAPAPAPAPVRGRVRNMGH